MEIILNDEFGLFIPAVGFEIAADENYET